MLYKLITEWKKRTSTSVVFEFSGIFFVNSGMEKIINIQNEKWKITLTRTHQLAFSYLVPYSRTIYATNPLWHNWDLNPSAGEDEFEDYIESVGVSDVNIFKIKSVLLSEIVKLLKQTKTVFFYFEANTGRKNNIYKRIRKDLNTLLGGDWSNQYADGYYYFSKK
jgi:hypothetical protein